MSPAVLDTPILAKEDWSGIIDVFLLVFGIPVLIIIVAFFGLLFILIHWLNRRSEEKRTRVAQIGACPKCGYDARFRSTNRCPECGEPL